MRKRLYRPVEFGAVEIRPQDVGEIELGIRRLPEEEVAEPKFARGADNEVGIGNVGRVEEAAESRL